MCGIAGGFAFDRAARQINPAIVSRLNERQRRRGPDDVGLWAADDKRVVLGNRRLAIVDRGDGGAQPMSDATARWHISFNGEIYNYRALRLELESLGRIFRTNSDTEVLINAIAHWGEAGLLKIRGMFAFALWDALERELWLARDPYGIKPLYVAESQGSIWFASQARALANCTPINIKREPAALAGFHLWGYVPEPFSWWKNIRMLPAGHVQRIRAGRPPGPAKAYARVQQAYMGSAAQPLSPGTLRSLLLDSVGQHLPADMPVGLFLSAGLDSAVIASLASELGADLHTITLAFDEYDGTADDEAPLARATAHILESNHVTARFGREEFEQVVDDFFSCMDQPTIDGLNTYLVSLVAARQGLKVVLSGLGGDELFGGYPSFRQIPAIMMWGSYVPFASSLGPLTERLLRRLALPHIPPKAAGLLSHSGDIASAYLLRRALYLEGELDGLLDENILREGLERLSTIHSVSEIIGQLPVTCYAQVAALESCWYLRNQLLRDTDWSSMSHGVEVRTPFVDAVLLGHLAPAIASDAPPSKQNLAACARSLPSDILARPKTGFCTPVQAWISPEGMLGRGFRGWASHVYHTFELATTTAPALARSAPQMAFSGRAHPSSRQSTASVH